MIETIFLIIGEVLFFACAVFLFVSKQHLKSTDKLIKQGEEQIKEMQRINDEIQLAEQKMRELKFEQEEKNEK